MVQAAHGKAPGCFRTKNLAKGNFTLHFSELCFPYSAGSFYGKIEPMLPKNLFWAPTEKISLYIVYLIPDKTDQSCLRRSQKKTKLRTLG